VHQVEARVDEGAIKIEDDKLYRVRIKRTADTNHVFLQNKAPGT
jgi:hypothetical protein